MRYLFWVFFLFFAIVLADDPTSVDSLDNYNGWGWHAYVMQNGLITTATMPAIGARTMQYDLGSHASIWINADEIGNVHAPLDGVWYNYGGFKNWPAPQSRWSWTPPPILDCGQYTCQAVINNADSVAIFVSSQVEQWKTPDLRFERRLTLYRGTTRLKVEQTLINERSSAQSWSVWDITQKNVQHGSQGDWENFWVYFTINPESKFGSDGVRTDGASDAWQGEVAPGIFGVQFQPDNTKIYADSHEGWVCYVDERDSTAYAKTFPLFEGADYPDQGAHVEVWINGGGLPYMEVEVVSPIVEMAANGGSYTFTEEWWAAKVPGPILNVNRIGAISQKLALHESEGTISGKFGSFHLGTAQIAFLDGGEAVIGQGVEHTVTPLELFVLNETVTKPEGTEIVVLRVKNSNGEVVGDLDMIDYRITSATDVPQAVPGNFTLHQNYPNPFNPQTTITVELQKSAVIELTIFDVTGKRIKTLAQGLFSIGNHKLRWDGDTDVGAIAPSGVYFYRLKSGGFVQSKKMILIH